MQREIKFRAWNANQQAWVVPYEGLEVWSSKETLPGFHVDMKHKFSLSQSTGLKDKSGKEIFEGDIVKLHNQKGIVTQVKFELGQFKMCWNPEGEKYESYYTFGEDPSRREVIGNIWENGDLLK